MSKAFAEALQKPGSWMKVHRSRFTVEIRELLTVNGEP